MASFEEDFARALESKLAKQSAQTDLINAETELAGENVRSKALGTALQGGAFAAYSDPAQVTALRRNLAGRGFGDTISRQPYTPPEALQPKAINFTPNTGSSFSSGGSGGSGGSTSSAFNLGNDYYKNGNSYSQFGYAEGGMVSAGTNPTDLSMSPLYKQYVKAMKNAGLGKSIMSAEEVIPRLAQQQAQLSQKLAKQTNMGGTGALGFADGGEVDVGGALLDGPGTGKSDSIPAMIDGEQPAALSKGEFVIPKKVVDYYGTKFLDAMVDKARMAIKKQAIA